MFQQARALGRKLKDLKDSLYNSEVQRGGQDDIHYLSRFADRYQRLSFGSGFAYAQPPGETVMEEWKLLRPELDAYLARFNEILKTDVTQFNQAAQAARRAGARGRPGDPGRADPAALIGGRGRPLHPREAVEESLFLGRQSRGAARVEFGEHALGLLAVHRVEPL